MSRSPAPIRIRWPWILTVALLILASSLACRLAILPAFSSSNAGTRSLAEQLLGQSATALADYSFFDKADGFYHRGRRHYVDTAFTNDIFQVLRQEISPEGHAHLQGDDMKDVLAWVRIAVSLDPRNVDYSLVAAYWLQRELGRTDAALALLREAATANPDSYLPYLGRGRLYGKLGDRTRARIAYQLAFRHWPGDSDKNDPDTMIDKREILVRLAILCELDNDIHGAIGFMNQIAEAFPSASRIVKEQAAMLERGEKPPVSAEQRWNTIREAEYHHFCTEEHGGNTAGDDERDGDKTGM